MKEKTTLQKRRPTSLLWCVVGIVFLAFEFVVIYSHMKEASHQPASWYFYEPILLAFPLLAAAALDRRLRRLLDADFPGEPSYSLALLTLVSYLTLWIGTTETR